MATKTPTVARRAPTRRQLAGGIAALLGTAGAATAAPADNPDAELLVLCARLEVVQRRLNGKWLQGINTRYVTPGSYIADEEKRENVIVPLYAEADKTFDLIAEHPPATMAGIRAIARCMLLAETSLRHDLDQDHFGLTSQGERVVHWLFRALAGGDITPETCTDGRAVLFGEDITPGTCTDGPAVLAGGAGRRCNWSADPDAALIAACAAYQARRVERIAAYASGDDAAADARQNAARDAEWAAYDEVAAFPPARTAAGHAAKALVAFAITERHMHPSGTDLDHDLVFARRVLAEVAGHAVPAAP
jgi:hypothetical protein